MRQQIIEGTDGKYSIREDGLLIRHYYNLVTRGKKMKIIEDKAFKPHMTDDNSFIYNIRLEKSQKRLIVKDLLHSYFIGEIPKNQVVKSKKVLSYPIDLNDLYLHKSRTRKEKDYLAGKRNIKNLTRKYVAFLLGLTIKTMPEELYLHHKNLILLKRQISKEHDIHISTLNYLSK